MLWVVDDCFLVVEQMFLVVDDCFLAVEQMLLAVDDCFGKKCPERGRLSGR